MDNNENNRPVCSCCGATIETDDYYTFDGNILCDECYHSETVTCEHCGDRIWADDNAGTDSMPLCNSCYDDYYTTCECCGRIIHRDYANYDDDDDYAYCDRCYEERQNSSIHEYNYKPDPIFYGDSKRYFGVELEIDEGGKNSDNADTLLGIGNRVAEHGNRNTPDVAPLSQGQNAVGRHHAFSNSHGLPQPQNKHLRTSRPRQQNSLRQYPGSTGRVHFPGALFCGAPLAGAAEIQPKD